MWSLKRLLALVGFVLVSAASNGSAIAAGPDVRLEAALGHLVEAKQGPPGAIAIVQRGRRRSVFRAGVADLNARRPMRVNDHMRLASTSKAFNGAVAMALVSRSRLKLGARLGALLPETPDAWRMVTVRQMLNHTSGIPSFTKNAGFLATLGANPHRIFDPASLLEFVAGDPLEFEPGSRYEYSNSDNIALGLIVAKITSGTYERALERFVSGQLGLKHTSLPRGYRMPRPYIHGYEVAPGHKPVDLSQALSSSSVWASGGMVSTPTELNRFARAYARGALLTRHAHRAQLRFVKGGSEPPGPGVNSAGLGIFRYRTACGTVYGHTGNYPGYTQFFAASRSGRRSVTVSVNTQLSPDAGAEHLFRVLRRADRLAVCAALRR